MASEFNQAHRLFETQMADALADALLRDERFSSLPIRLRSRRGSNRMNRSASRGASRRVLRDDDGGGHCLSYK